MKYTQIKKNNSTVCTLSGEINLESSPDLRKFCAQLLAKGEKNMILNFKDVSYVDSSGLATLIELFQKIKEKSGSLKLCSLSDKVKGVFELTKLDRVFKICPSEEDALRD